MTSWRPAKLNCPERPRRPDWKQTLRELAIMLPLGFMAIFTICGAIWLLFAAMGVR